MAKLNLAKFNEDIARRVLSKGATLPTANKILGNYKFLSQTKNKARFGLDKFQFAGRPTKGKPRVYYSESEIQDGELVYPIAEMNNFNQRLANELHYFRLFGFAVKDLNYEPGKKIARVDFIQMDPFGEFQITFFDLSDARYLRVSSDSSTDRNLFVLPQTGSDDTETIAISKEQDALLKLNPDLFSVVVATILSGDEYYELNLPGSHIFKTHSFLKRNGIYNMGLLKYDNIPDSEQFTDYQIFEDDKQEQLDTNGFYIKDGRISEFSQENQNLVLSEFNMYVLDQFDKNFVLANRYFGDLYSTDPQLQFSQVDELIDDITREEFGKASFSEFEQSLFDEFKDKNDDSVEEEDASIDSGLAGMFDKVQDDAPVKINKTETSQSEQPEDIQHEMTSSESGSFEYDQSESETARITPIQVETNETSHGQNSLAN